MKKSSSVDIFQTRFPTRSKIWKILEGNGRAEYLQICVITSRDLLSNVRSAGLTKMGSGPADRTGRAGGRRDGSRDRTCGCEHVQRRRRRRRRRHEGEGLQDRVEPRGAPEVTAQTRFYLPVFEDWSCSALGRGSALGRAIAPWIAPRIAAHRSHESIVRT